MSANSKGSGISAFADRLCDKYSFPCAGSFVTHLSARQLAYILFGILQVCQRPVLFVFVFVFFLTQPWGLFARTEMLSIWKSS